MEMATNGTRLSPDAAAASLRRVCAKVFVRIVKLYAQTLGCCSAKFVRVHARR